MAQGVRKGTIFNIFGQYGAAFFIFLFQVIAARFLGPSKFGLLSLLYSLIMTFKIVLSSGARDTLMKNIPYYQAIGDEEALNTVYKKSTLIFSILAGLFLLISLSLSQPISLKLFDDNLILLFEFILGVLLLSSFRFFLSVVEGRREFHLVSLFLVSHRIFLLIGIIIGLMIEKSAVSTGAGIALSPVIPLLILLVLTFSRNWFSISGKQKPIKGLELFIIEISLLNFFGIFLLRLGPLMLKLLGGENANFYNGLYIAIFMPLNLMRGILIALFTSLFPNISRAFGEKNKEQIKRYIRKSTFIVLYVIISISLVFLLWGPAIVKLLYGKSYEVQRLDCILISLMIGFYMFARLINRILVAGGKYRVSLFSIIGSLFVAIIAVVLLEMSPMIRVELSLLAGTFFYAVSQAYYLFFKSNFL